MRPTPARDPEEAVPGAEPRSEQAVQSRRSSGGSETTSRPSSRARTDRRCRARSPRCRTTPAACRRRRGSGGRSSHRGAGASIRPEVPGPTRPTRRARRSTPVRARAPVGLRSRAPVGLGLGRRFAFGLRRGLPFGPGRTRGLRHAPTPGSVPAASSSSPSRPTSTFPPDRTTATRSPSRIGIRPASTAASAAAPAGSRTCLRRSTAKRSPARIVGSSSEHDVVEVAPAHRQRPDAGERRAEPVGDALGLDRARPRRVRAPATRRSIAPAPRRRPGCRTDAP